MKRRIAETYLRRRLSILTLSAIISRHSRAREDHSRHVQGLRIAKLTGKDALGVSFVARIA